jgi:NAD+ kinase
VTAPRSVTLYTHQSVEATTEAVGRLLEEARRAGIAVRVPREEAEKHGFSDGDAIQVVDGGDSDTDVAVTLGGDGTILRALRDFAGTGVPTFAFNFGDIGFLATVDDFDDGLRRVLSGEFESLSMPALSIETGQGTRWAAGDVSFHRRPGARVAYISYSLDGEQLGQVRCDGLVASTPAGSTGYNLANGGPLLAWGVAGYVISFIAPHSLTARPVVAAPEAVLSVQNESQSEALEVTTDGRPVDTLAPRAAMEIGFRPDVVVLAQAPGSSFYHRLRDKFGRIAS